MIKRKQIINWLKITFVALKAILVAITGRKVNNIYGYNLPNENNNPIIIIEANGLRKGKLWTSRKYAFLWRWRKNDVII